MAVCIAGFIASKQAIKSYFDNNWEKTAGLVKENGGHVYNGHRAKGHLIWHPVFIGLGDFDKNYGYKWADPTAYRYAIPVLKEKYGINLSYTNRAQTDDFYDEAKQYYIKFEEIPEYPLVLRDKVIQDISNDIFWYLEILGKRIVRTLTITIPLPYVGLLVFPLVFYLVRYRYYDYLALIIVSLPLSTVPVLIYSGRGSTYNSVYVYFVLAISLIILINKFLKPWKSN